MSRPRLLSAGALALLAALLAAPAAAHANPNDGPYAGSARDDPQAKVKFDVSGGDLVDLNVSHLAFHCRRRADLRRNPPPLDGTVEISNDAFRGRLVRASPTHIFTATIAGRLLEGGGAQGWLRYSIRFPNGDVCRAVPAPLDWTATNRDLRFASGFGSPVTVEPPVAVNGNWRFPIIGDDRGFAWDSDLPGHTQNAFFPIVPASEPIDDYAATRIERVKNGPHGTPTRALFQAVLQDGQFYSNARVRNQFPLVDTGRRGSVSYWIRLQPNLSSVMPRGEKSWRLLMELRGTNKHPDDYRMSIGLLRRRNGPLIWEVAVRRLLPSYEKVWTSLRKRPQVPIGRWFRLQASWLISRRDGYLRATVDGVPIANYEGPTMLEEPIDSIQIFKVYTARQALAHGPAYQWIDDVEIRRGLLSPLAQPQQARPRR